ncbi:MAG TPA: DUF2750 domain-containing protein [Tepidisphaeraceae bacterium]|nr:DUF2750 domain-containing protein [Tepidisphaeraceae bacterium]
MEWIVSDKEYESVIRLKDQVRYEYFIKRVADYSELWSLKGKAGWELLGDDAGNESIPLWPHRRYADGYAKARSLADVDPAAISLSDFLSRWIPGMAKDNRLAAVFPTPANRSIVVLPERLKKDLGMELSRIE